MIVGPDIIGNELEPLSFKGIADIRESLEYLGDYNDKIEIIRISNSGKEIFKDYPCEFYVTPSNEMKTKLYGNADILIYASHYDSIPLPPLEAMSSGTVVICTETDGAKEYCVDGVNSMLVPVKSPESIAKSLIRLIDNPELRNQLIEAGIKTAEVRSQKNSGEEMLKIINEFLSEEKSCNNEIPIITKEQPTLESKKEWTTGYNRLLIFIDEKEYDSALRKIIKLLDNFDCEQGKYCNTDLVKLTNIAGNLALLTQDYESARLFFEKALNADPESSAACAGLAEIFYVNENYEASKEMFEFSVKFDSANETAIKRLKNIDSILNEQTLPCNQKSSNLDDVLNEILNKVYKLFSLKAYEKAIDALEQTKALFYANFEDSGENTLICVYENLKGFNFLGMNDTIQARQCFERALQLDPGSSQACTGLGETFYLEGMDKEAKVMFEWGVKNNPENKMAEEGLKKVNSILCLMETDNSLVLAE